MLVSVVIPTYNRAALAVEAVASVLAQTHGDLECLVVDDGSTDHTAQVLGGLDDPRLRILRTPNRGVSAARNLGLFLARGEWLALLDSDDLWKPGKLARQLAYVSAHGYEVCQTREIWMRGGRRVNPPRRHDKPEGFIFERCLDLCVISPSCVLFSRRVFQECGPFDEDMPACEDYDLWLRVSLGHRVGLVPEDLVVRRGGRADQLSLSEPRQDLYRVQALLKLLKNAPLTDTHRRSVVQALARRAGVYAAGCRKRGRMQEAEEVAALAAVHGVVV